MKLPYSRTTINYLELEYLKRKLKRENWTFTSNRIEMIHKEQKEWEKTYLPTNIEGKTVLDIGAGEGETARFFLKHGAKHVIAIEPSPLRYPYLTINASNHWDITPINERFHPIQLISHSHALCKIDIDGWEEQLLQNLGCLSSPTVIEVHGLQLIEKFKEKGFTVKTAPEEWLAYAYWMCPE